MDQSMWSLAQMEHGNSFLYKYFRMYTMEDTPIYEGMIFKANHNLFEVNKVFKKINSTKCDK